MRTPFSPLVLALAALAGFVRLHSVMGTATAAAIVAATCAILPALVYSFRRVSRPRQRAGMPTWYAPAGTVMALVLGPACLVASVIVGVSARQWVATIPAALSAALTWSAVMTIFRRRSLQRPPVDRFRKRLR
jgi:hypothetical protein